MKLTIVFSSFSFFLFLFLFSFFSPSNRVLLVCTELCSLHMQLDDRVDNLVGSALFADGSGALVIGNVVREGERPLFEMHRNASVIIPDTLDMMAWSVEQNRVAL
jgi:alpha-pyrone synthase